jgi:signal transduction histidine kinase
MITSATTSSLFWQKQIHWGIQRWQLAAVGAFYLFFAVVYLVTLELNAQSHFPAFVLQVTINYLARLPPSLLVWWLLFVRLASWHAGYRIALHLVLCPLWVAIQVSLYHWGCDLVGEDYMTGTALVWDLYIPALFYIIQFAVYHVYDYYLKLQKEKERAHQLEKLALESELTALKAQLNPHFLFNTLNSINASLPPELESVREQIARLADMFRYPLSVFERTLVPLSEEIAFVENYLLLEKERFGARLQFDIQSSPAALRSMLPPLVIQPLVENSIKHGLSSLIEGGRVDIRCYMEGQILHVSVEDNGKGIDQPAGNWLFEKGLGLKNTQLRLEKMFGQQLEISTPVNGGLLIQMQIPQV